VLVAQLKKARA